MLPQMMGALSSLTNITHPLRSFRVFATSSPATRPFFYSYLSPPPHVGGVMCVWVFSNPPPVFPPPSQQTLADQLGLRVTQERCPSVFGSSSSSSSSLRRSQVQLLATSLVYLICRQEGCGRTLEEMTAACPGVDKSSLGRMHGALARELRLPPARVAPADLVNRLASHARLSPVTSIRARHVCQEVSKYSLCQSLSPQLVAAAALVLVGLASRQETINLTSLAQGTLSCSIPQIRKVYLTLRTHATLLLPADVQSSFGDIALLPLSLAIFPDTIPPLGVGGAGVVKRSRSGSGSGSGSHSLQTSSTGGETLGEGERGGKLKKQSTAKSGVGGVGV